LFLLEDCKKQYAVFFSGKQQATNKQPACAGCEVWVVQTK
jgi:hypothetical protein